MAAAAAPVPAPTAPARGKKKLLLAAAAVVLLAGGGAGGAYVLGYLGGGSAQADATSGTSTHEADAAGAEDGHDVAEDRGDGHEKGAELAADVTFVDLPDIVVNLHSDGRRMRFLRLRLALEVGNKRQAEEVGRLTPRVLDSFQVYLRALTVDDVVGPVGLQKIKEEMMARINLALSPRRVDDVLVKEMLVQ